jgi:hypothetical protein
MNEHSISSKHGSDDLLWVAAQYAAGDLPESAVERFEEQLETDQAAREALAQAVALSQAVAQVEATPVAPVSIDRSRRFSTAAALAIAVAACLALTFVALQLPKDGDAPNQEVAKSPENDAQRLVAMAWVAGQVGEEDFTETDDPTLADEPMFDDVDEFDDLLPMPTSDPSAPDWLLAALADAAPAEGGK